MSQNDLSKKIKDLRNAHGLTLEQVADCVGVGKSTVRKWETGMIENMRRDKIAKLAEALHTTPGYLMGWEDEPHKFPSNFRPMPEMRQIPRIGRIACGEPITAEENIEGYDETPAGWHADFSLLCVGDSMSPKVEDGDIVAIRCQPQVNNGEIAAVRIGDEATLKMVFIHQDYVELRPVNPSYPSIIRRLEEMEDIRIEGKAVGLCRDL